MAVRSRSLESICRRIAEPADVDLMVRSLEFRQFWAYKNLPVSPGVVVRDRLSLLGHVLLHPLRRLASRRRRVVAEEFLVFETAACRSNVEEVRRYFFKKAFGQEIGFIGHVDASSGPRGSFVEVLRYWPRFVWFALGALFDPAPMRLSFLGRAMRHVMDVLPAATRAERVYFTSMHDPIVYFTAAWLRDVAGVDVWLVTSNTPLYRWTRLCHLRAPIVLCSVVQQQELQALAAQGINNAGPAVYVGNEYALELVGVDREPRVDLGYFSSGMWARVGGLAQTGDIKGIREGQYRDNPYYAATEPIIESMARIAREHDLKMVIYLHPFERELLKVHGIEPPYARFADGRNVVLDTRESSSRPRMFEPRIAVSLQSTIIWERIDAGATESYIYRFDDQALNGFDADVLGDQYARCWFSSPCDLESRIIGEVTEGACGLTGPHGLR